MASEAAGDDDRWGSATSSHARPEKVRRIGSEPDGGVDRVVDREVVSAVTPVGMDVDV